jgi:hypothetical protein
VNLELMALRWLRWEKKCPMAFCERSPVYGNGEPDVLGITAARYRIEIEIKRSISDFRADFKKSHRINQKFNLEVHPRQFYYLTPHELVPKIKPLLPSWAGLMQGPTDNYYAIQVVIQAPINDASERLTIRECSRMVKMVNNHAMSVMECYEKAFNRFKDGHWQWQQEDYEI